MAKSKSDLTPALIRSLVRALRKHPELTDAADAVGIHPQTLKLEMRKGYLQQTRESATLTRLARAARATNRAELYSYLKIAARHDPKWAAYLLERSDEEGDAKWSETVAREGEESQTVWEALNEPGPELQRMLDDLGYDRTRVPRLPAAPVDGELVDE